MIEIRQVRRTKTHRSTYHPSPRGTSNKRNITMSHNTSANGDGNPISIPITNKDLFDTRGLVAGSWKTPEDGKSFPVYEPSSGKVLRQCSDFGHQDFIDAIDVADKGYRHFWSSTTAKERGSLLRAWYEQILENADDCECHETLQMC